MEKVSVALKGIVVMWSRQENGEDEFLKQRRGGRRRKQEVSSTSTDEPA